MLAKKFFDLSNTFFDRLEEVEVSIMCASIFGLFPLKEAQYRKILSIFFLLFFSDRTPFVLTPDMAYVINGGDKSTEKFHHFVDLCCQAFNVVRKHGNLLLNLFGLVGIFCENFSKKLNFL